MANVTESFQQQMLALATGVCNRSNAKELETIAAKMPIALKL